MRSFIEANLDPLVTIGPKGVITDANEAAVRVTGRTRAELMGSDFADCFTAPHEAREGYRAARTDGAVRDFPLTIRHADGRSTDVLYNAWKYRDAQGEVLGILATARKVTPRRLEVEVSARADGMFRAAVESAPMAMLMVDRAGTISMVNRHAEKLFGYGREELLGQKVDVLVPERFRSEHPRLRWDYFDVPESRRMGMGRDLHAVRRDGTTFPAEIGLNPIVTDEGVFVIAAIADITERLAAQAQKIASLRREVLLKEIHHRVKNNLQVISSLLFLQSRHISDPAMREVLAESQSRVKSIALIHEKLYRSDDLERLDFSDYVKDLVAELFHAHGPSADRVALEMDLGEIFLEIDTAIPCGLVINELISNAFKHAFPDGRCGRVKVTLARSSPSELSLTIRDDGVGLPAGLDWRRGGSFGLKLVVDLVKQLDGRIELDGSAGTAVEITFSDVQPEVKS